MKRALIITYYWPPSGGAGVQRWLKFAKYLPEYGWDPVILTVDPRHAVYPQKDLNLMEEVPDSTEVRYATAPTGIFSAYKKLTGNKELPYGGFANESDPRLLQKILRFIRGNFFLPDARAGWNRYAFKEAVKIIREHKTDIVITSSPPHSSQLIGLKLKRKLNVKWIADLRDPWTEIYYSGEMYQTRLARKINSIIEKRVLNSADRVIATCDATRDLFRSKISGNQSEDKIITVTNGFDPDDFAGQKIIPLSFAITYLGTISSNYDLKVIDKAADQYAEVKGIRINMRFIGKTDEKSINILRRNKNIAIEIIPYVDHKKAVQYMLGSSALLLIVPSDSRTNEMIPAKLFEYLASGRPVIALGRHDSHAARILRDTGGGRIFDKDDNQKLAEYILEIRNNFDRGINENKTKGTDQYSRKKLAEKISNILEAL